MAAAILEHEEMIQETIGSEISSVINGGRDDKGLPAGDFLNTLDALKEVTRAQAAKIDAPVFPK